MDALNVITLKQAKDWLELDYEDEDTDDQVESLIKAAVSWVEQYTSHYLYERTITLPNSNCAQSIAAYPISITSVKNQQGTAVTYKTYVQPTKLRLTCPYNSVIVATVGYATPADIPHPLIEAAKKWIVYMWENRDIYQAQLPSDLQILINQYRRALA